MNNINAKNLGLVQKLADDWHYMNAQAAKIIIQLEKQEDVGDIRGCVVEFLEKIEVDKFDNRSTTEMTDGTSWKLEKEVEDYGELKAVVRGQ